MSQNAVSKFIDAMLLHYPPFRWDEEQEKSWSKTMVVELRGFGAAVLEKAATTMIRTRKDRRTPLVAECVQACVEARRWLDIEKGASELPIDEKQTTGEWTADRFKLANDLIRTPLGREAAKGGWIGALHGFARRNARAPVGPEIQACKQSAKEFDAAYKLCVQGGWPYAHMLERLGAAMLKRREKLSDMVLHGVVE